MMPQRGKDKNDEFSIQKMAIKVTKGQICNGSISKKLCHKEYNLYGKFHNCIKNCTIWHYAALLLGGFH